MNCWTWKSRMSCILGSLRKTDDNTSLSLNKLLTITLKSPWVLKSWETCQYLFLYIIPNKITHLLQQKEYYNSFKKKKKDHEVLAKRQSDWNSHELLGRIQNGIAMLENCLTVSCTVKHLLYYPPISLLGINPSEIKNLRLHKKRYEYL